MSQPFGRLYQPQHVLRHAGEIPHFSHVHPSRLNHGPPHNGPPQHHRNGVQVYTYPRPQQQRYNNYNNGYHHNPHHQQNGYNNHHHHHNGYHNNYNNGYNSRGRGRGQGRGRGGNNVGGGGIRGGGGGIRGGGGHPGGGRGRIQDDLEWDDFDLGLSGQSKGRGKKNTNAFSKHRGSGSGVETSELEWDDYDLRPKDDKEEDSQESLDVLLSDGFLPLDSQLEEALLTKVLNESCSKLQLGVMTKGSLSKGNLPVGAIQVRRVPNNKKGKDHHKKAFDLNKELLVLTSELNGTSLRNGDQSDSHEVRDLLRRRNSDTSQKSSSSGKYHNRAALRNAAYHISSDLCEDDLLDADAYELNFPDRLADVDVYALSPQDFDSPDSIFSRSLADLTDLSLYEELGLEASQGGEEVASIGDISLEKIGEDLSDEVYKVGSPRPPNTKSNNRRRKGKDGLKNKSKKAKKRKRKGSEKTADGTGGDDDDKKPKRLAPNYFVAIQVASPTIHNALLNVQKTVVTGDEKLKDAMVPISTLHLTIMVMHLAGEEDETRAKAALRECNEVLSPRFEDDGQLRIAFQGLGHFNNQVMFAKIKDEESIVEKLYDIAVTVEKIFNNHNIFSTGERGFKPHLTIMKLSRAPSLRKKGVRRIKSELYKVHSTENFGDQLMDGLQLCSINKPKSSEGYYYKAEEIFFGKPSPVESINEAEPTNLPANNVIKNGENEKEDNKVNDWIESMDSTNTDTPNSTENGDIKDNTNDSTNEDKKGEEDNKDIDNSKDTIPDTNSSSPTSNGNKGNNNLEEKTLKDPSIIESTNSQQDTADNIVK